MLLGSTGLARADVLGDLNNLRARGCAGRAPVAGSLRRSARLDAVARELARGFDLRTAEHRAGYHASASAAIALSGIARDASVRDLLARRFCAQALDPAFGELGEFRHDERVWLALAQPFQPPATRDAADIAQRVLELTNRARAQPRRCGDERFPAAPPLRPSRALAAAARVQAQDMAHRGLMDHRGSDGSDPGIRVARTGYRWRRVGENLAMGILTPEQVVTGWLHSPHHCANLMSGGFQELGVAFAVNPRDDAGVYWAQVFATAR